MLQRLLASLVLILVPSLAHAADSYTLTISAGKSDRMGSAVSFQLPDGVQGAWHVVTADNKQLPLYISGNQGTFIVANLGANETGRFKLERGEAKAENVKLAREGNVLKISAGGKPILTYQGDPSSPPEGVEAIFKRGGYLHPVYTPSGKLLTDDYPPDHKHHHGIWSPWTKTEFEGRHPDFWNMGQKLGRVEFVSLGETISNPVFAGFQTHHRMIDMTAQPEKVAINETWDVKVYAPVNGPKPCYIFDLAIHQECASESPLILPKYHYGGLGFRGNRQWAKNNCFFITSEGKDRSNGNETKGRWCHVSGKTDGEMMGVAIFDHPDNFRSPQPMRLNPTEPFFCFAPSQDGDWKIEPGKPYEVKYRFVVADGGPDKELIERLYRDWADPPKVEVK